MARHNILGSAGEQLVTDELVRRGFSIRERNWKSGHLEIDIIAVSGNEIAFVEVKTRSREDDDPLRAIDRKKMINLGMAASVYLQMLDIPLEPRFDVALVSMGENGPELTYIPDAFFPPLKTYH